MKVSPIGKGQYRFKVYAAVGDGAGYVGAGRTVDGQMPQQQQVL